MRDAVSPIAVIVELGAVVLVATLLPLGVGIWLDGKFNSAPWITLVGLIVGVTGAVTAVYLVVSKRFKSMD